MNTNRRNDACLDAQSALWRHLDGELGESEAAQLRGHLLACPACRAVFQEHRGLQRWFVAEPVVKVPEGFAARVAALAVGGSAVAAVAGEPRGPGRGPAQGDGEVAVDGGSLLRFTTTLVAVAAALLLALSLALVLDSQPRRPATLAADPLPEALERLDELNRAERDLERQSRRVRPPAEQR